MKKEILDLGYEVSQVEDGRVTFIGDAEAICRANILLRTTERVLLKVGSFHAETFEELFQGTRAIPWEEYLPKDAKFWVAKASSIKSKLFSPSDIQSIMKKAMVERMKKAYGIEWFPESGASFPLRVFLHKDTVTVALDTTGEAGGGTHHADSVEERPDPRGSVLRKRNLPDRGGDDRSEYGAGHEPGIPLRGLETSDPEKMLV